MATHKYTRTSYSLKKPDALSMEQYLKKRSSVPIYPKPINVTNQVLKKYWFMIIIYIVIPPAFLLSWLSIVADRRSKSITYSDDNVFDYPIMLKRQNEISNEFYSAIYKSSDYNDYLERYRRI